MMATLSRVANRNVVRILNVAVDHVSIEQAMDIIRRYLSESTPRIVVTADASGIVQAQSDDAYRKILDEADLVTPDSIGVVWAAKRLGNRMSGRVSGVDLFAKICALSADKGYRIFLLGAAPGVAELAAEKLRLRYPGCNVVGTRHGYFPADSDEIVAHEIAEKKPDVLFVAMGIPRQEKFIKRTQEIIGAKVAMGVGGTLDVFSGKTKRAPMWVQKVRAEWLWRLLLNPAKISKVKALPVFAWRVLRSKR